MDETQRAEPDFLTKYQGSAGVKPEERFAGYQGVRCKSRVGPGIFDREDTVAENGEVAESMPSGGAIRFDAKLCLEHLEIGVEQRHDCRVDAKMPCCFRTKRIKRRYRRSNQQAARSQHAHPLDLVWPQGKLCHAVTVGKIER